MAEEEMNTHDTYLSVTKRIYIRWFAAHDNDIFYTLGKMMTIRPK
jgi:hypothetical protein